MIYFKRFYTAHRSLFLIFIMILVVTAIFIYSQVDGQGIEPTEPTPASIPSPTPTPLITHERVVRIKESKKMLPPTPFLEVIPPPKPSAKPPRYGFTEDEIYLLAVLLSGSKDVDGDGEFDIDYGRDEEYDQITLVLCVVMNRVRSDKWPNTVSEVLWQDGQFTAMLQWLDQLPEVSDISIKRVKEWCNAYDTYDIGAQGIPEYHLFFTGDGINNYSR